MIVFLHGFTGSPGSFDAVRAKLTVTEPASALALVGHGATGDGAVRTFDDEVDRLAGALEGPSVLVVGYSLGGRLALGLAARHPERVRGVVAVGASAGLATAGERLARVVVEERWIARLEREGIDAFVEAWEAQPLFASQRALPEELRARRRAERLAHDAAGLARSLRATGLSRMPHLLPALRARPVPLTLVAGADDAKFAAIARHLGGELPHARVHRIEGVGHDAVLEAPDAVARIVDAAAVATAKVAEVRA